MTVTSMVALGSSFAAGPGLRPVADRRAMRSTRNYPHLAAEMLGATLIDATVSGATTDTILTTPQRVGMRAFPPQIATLRPGLDVDLVTVTAGGNDLGYLGGVVATAIAHRFDRALVTRPIAARLRASVPPLPGEEQVERAAAGLVRVVEEVARRAPQARILLVGYLTIVGPGPHRSPSPFTPDELIRIRTTGERVERAFRTAAERSQAELVSMADASAAHGFDAAEPWVNPLELRLPRSRLASSFHPNPSGAQAVARAIVQHLAPR